jgi:hypothetical protein
MKGQGFLGWKDIRGTVSVDARVQRFEKYLKGSWKGHPSF